MQLIDAISASCLSCAQYWYLHTKHADDFCRTIPQVPNADSAPDSRAALNEEKRLQTCLLRHDID